MKRRVQVAVAPEVHGFASPPNNDGKGSAADQLEAVFQCCRRLNEAVAGSGRGLAILRDIVDLYGGSIRLGCGALGGLEAVLELPALLA